MRTGGDACRPGAGMSIGPGRRGVRPPGVVAIVSIEPRLAESRVILAGGRRRVVHSVERRIGNGGAAAGAEQAEQDDGQDLFHELLRLRSGKRWYGRDQGCVPPRYGATASP